jgi:hypothetical protein
MSELKKERLLEMPQSYSVASLDLNGTTCLAVGRETHGSSFILPAPTFEPVQFCDGPGGMMSLIPVPGTSADLVSIMGLFPPFISDGAGVFLHRPVGPIDGEWEQFKLFDLPFSHRMAFLRNEGRCHLFTASVSRHKKDPSDWEQPGDVYVAELGDHPERGLEITPVLKDITRNHGMLKTAREGVEVILVTGAEGMFEIAPAGGGWATKHLLDIEISEVALIDLDGDGREEMVTIEPFHGDTLRVYRRNGEGWEAVYDSPLSFGHGLWSGTLGGRPAVAVGSRSDGKELLLFRPGGDDPLQLQRIVVEEGAGPTNITSVTYDGADYLISSNPGFGEVAWYTSESWGS